MAKNKKDPSGKTDEVPTMIIPTEEFARSLSKVAQHDVPLPEPPTTSPPKMLQDTMSQLLGNQSVPQVVEESWRGMVGEQPPEVPQAVVKEINYQPTIKAYQNIKTKPDADPLLVEAHDILWRLDMAFLLSEVPYLRTRAKKVMSDIANVIEDRGDEVIKSEEQEESTESADNDDNDE